MSQLTNSLIKMSEYAGKKVSRSPENSMKVGSTPPPPDRDSELYQEITEIKRMLTQNSQFSSIDVMRTQLSQISQENNRLKVLIDRLFGEFGGASRLGGVSQGQKSSFELLFDLISSITDRLGQSSQFQESIMAKLSTFQGTSTATTDNSHFVMEIEDLRQRLERDEKIRIELEMKIKMLEGNETYLLKRISLLEEAFGAVGGELNDSKTEASSASSEQQELIKTT